MIDPSSFRDVYAVPGENWIIDQIDPVSGLTCINQRDLASIQAEHPTAIRMSWAFFRAAATARQQTPITWQPTTKARYWEMLEVLPPAYWAGGAFLVGEAMDHCFATGRPRFEAYAERHGAYYVASRPLTVAELKEQTR